MTKDVQVQSGKESHVPQTQVDMGRMLDRFFSDPFGVLLSEIPRRSLAQVRETDDSYQISVEIPGVPNEDVEINVDGNMLSIRAERREEKDEEDTYFKQYRSYSQSFSLPSNVDTDNIEARLENGVLELALPKTETQKKKIEIQSGQKKEQRKTSQQEPRKTG